MSERTLQEYLALRCECDDQEDDDGPCTMCEAAGTIASLESTNARLVAALGACVKAARYYEREKPSWCENDDAHDDAIDAAEQALASAGGKGGGADADGH